MLQKPPPRRRLHWASALAVAAGLIVFALALAVLLLAFMQAVLALNDVTP
jgi:hypothetical protein